MHILVGRARTFFFLSSHDPLHLFEQAQSRPFQHGLGRVQISTMCVKRNLLVAGGFQGEMICKVR